MNFAPDATIQTAHTAWLSKFNTVYLKAWQDLLLANPEAAMCEAHVRDLLQNSGCTVSPYLDHSGKQKSPDFQIEVAAQQFFVEVTCLEISAVTKKTGLAHPFRPGAGHHGDLSQLIFGKCQRKERECAAVSSPCLLAIGTFHHHASAICLQDVNLEMVLTGEQLISFPIDLSSIKVPDSLEASGITHLKNAAFCKPAVEAIESARTAISGLILCGFGCIPAQIRGVLHHQAARPFDSSLLPGLNWYRLRLPSTDAIEIEYKAKDSAYWQPLTFE